MKQNIKFAGLLVAVAWLVTPSVKADTYDSTVIPDFSKVTVEEVNGYDGNRYSSLSVEEGVYLSDIGTPDIPYMVYEIEVPTYSNGYAVETVSCIKGESVVLGHPLWPHQPDVSLNDNPADFFTVLDSARISSATEISPVVMDDYFVRGRIHVLRVGVPLCGYGPGASSVTPYTSFTLRLNYERCTEGGMAHRPLRMERPATKCRLYDGSAMARATSYGNGDNSRMPMYYYIITPEKFREDLADLEALKRAKGLNVRIHAIEDILASSTGIDDAEKLRNWLIANVDTASFDNYVLLVGGNKTKIPIRKFRDFDDKAKEKNGVLPFDDIQYVPSDAYYSDFTTVYPLALEKDNIHYSCYIETLPYSPAVPVGRIIVRKAEEIHNYISKLLDYEMYPGHGDMEYLRKGVYTRQQDGLGCNPIFNTLDFKGNVIRMDDNLKETFEERKPTGQEIIQEISDAGIISLNGHGAPMFIGLCGSGNNKWAWHYLKPLEGYFDKNIGGMHQFEYNNSFDLMRNYHHPSVLYTLSCESVPLDEYNEDGWDHCMGSAYTVAGLFGGVAYIGNTRYGRFGGSSLIEQKLGYLLSSDPPIGNAFINSKKASDDHHLWYTNILIGDPEFRVWRGIPSDLGVSCNVSNGNVNIQSTELDNTRLSVNNGNTLLSSGILAAETSSYSLTSSLLSAAGIPGESGYCSQVYISKPGYLPFTTLLVNDALIRSKRRFVLNEMLYLNGNEGNSITVFDNGNLNIRCLRSISCENALTARQGGKIAISSDESVSLKGDAVEAGGNLDIQAKEVTLEAGFHVDKGGILNISTHK